MKGIDRIFVVIISLKNNPETVEINYSEDSCMLLRLDVVALTLVCRQIVNCAIYVTRKNATKYSAGQYHRILKQLIETDPSIIELGRPDDETGIAKSLKTHKAVYREKCYDKIGLKELNRLLARVWKKPCSETNVSSSTLILHKRKKAQLGTELCIFCGERNSTEKLCAAGVLFW